MPCTSAGRVRSRERRPQEIIQRASGKFAVVHDHDEREDVERVMRINRSAEAFDRRLSLSTACRNVGPTTATMPGRHKRGSPNPSGNVKPAGRTIGSSPRRPGRRDDDFRARVQAGPRIIECVDRRLRLEMEVRLPIDARQHVR